MTRKVFIENDELKVITQALRTASNCMRYESRNPRLPSRYRMRCLRKHVLCLDVLKQLEQQL